ncbi:MAG: 3-dehydroquinate synthase [Rhodothermales bacterium]|nr:3-dehydroquinate synthase [Rhodothermales bacterium]
MEADSITVSLPKDYERPSYEVLVRIGSLEDAPELIERAAPAYRYALITDTQVGELYGKKLLTKFRDRGLDSELFTFAAGEWNKTREIWGQVTDSLLAAGMGRDSTVIAVGGGVVGDLAGFVAATYMRGIPVVQIPTSLLAMVDSSVGGKTGIDTRAGKNLVGAFHQPAFVLIDPAVLKTLPMHQLSAGVAEVIKHGLIRDAEYFEQVEVRIEELLARDMGLLATIIRRSIEIKAEVVRRDEKESGYRRILNFGHTVAHALEAVSGYELLHGEAVAIGMASEAAIGETMGVTAPGATERIRRVLEAARLPIHIEGACDRARFFEALAKDKKRLRGAARYTLIADVGSVAGSEEDGWTHEVADEVVSQALFG